MEVGRVARQYDHAAGWIGAELVGIEFLAKTDVKKCRR